MIFLSISSKHSKLGVLWLCQQNKTVQSMTVEYESRIGAIINWFTTVCCPSHAPRKWGTEGFNNGLLKHLKKKEHINATQLRRNYTG